MGISIINKTNKDNSFALHALEALSASMPDKTFLEQYADSVYTVANSIINNFETTLKNKKVKNNFSIANAFKAEKNDEWNPTKITVWHKDVSGGKDWILAEVTITKELKK